jgi:hypothetical protein
MTAIGHLLRQVSAHCILAAFVVGLPGGLSAETGPERAERLLAAMGGREAWAKVRFVHVEAVHDQLNVRDPFTNRI